jgi:hypothetical protein
MRHPLFILILANIFAVFSNACAEQPDELKPLNHFVGAWDIAVTHAPTPALAAGAKSNAQEHMCWFLKDRVVLSRGLSQPDGVKSLWVLTYDPNKKSYPMWYFNTAGVIGGEWRGTWDEASKTLTSSATDTPAGWTSKGTNQFPDKQSSLAAAWMKDDAGTLLFSMEWKKTRQSAEAGEKILAAWAKPEEIGAQKTPEMKILERLAGTWDSAAVFKVAEWTPEEVKSKSKVTRTWVLNNQFLQDISVSADGNESLGLFTYDARMKAYRSWWFSSEGHNNKSSGSWDAATETFTFKTEMENGLKSQNTVQLIDKDRQEWRVLVKDEAGKLYFCGEWSLTRHKE